jgi:hypothetical protein
VRHPKLSPRSSKVEEEADEEERESEHISSRQTSRRGLTIGSRQKGKPPMFRRPLFQFRPTEDSGNRVDPPAGFRRDGPHVRFRQGYTKDEADQYPCSTPRPSG